MSSVKVPHTYMYEEHRQVIVEGHTGHVEDSPVYMGLGEI